LFVYTRGQKNTKLYSDLLMWTATEDDKTDVEFGSLKCFWNQKISIKFIPIHVETDLKLHVSVPLTTKFDRGSKLIEIHKIQNVLTI